MLNAAALLAIEIETLWVSDAAGRLLHTREATPSPAPDFVVARSGSGSVLAFGSRLPQSLVGELESITSDAGDLPGLRDAIRTRLEAHLGPVADTQSLAYLIPANASSSHDANIVTSSNARAAIESLSPPPGALWGVTEWQALLAGELGPWAAAVVDGVTASHCHTSRLGPRGVEAGVFTAPAFRGRRLAAPVTAAWAAECANMQRHLFYSTSIDNLASQRVAKRLVLPEIGRMWQFFASAGHNDGHA